METHVYSDGAAPSTRIAELVGSDGVYTVTLTVGGNVGKRVKYLTPILESGDEVTVIINDLGGGEEIIVGVLAQQGGQKIYFPYLVPFFSNGYGRSGDAGGSFLNFELPNGWTEEAQKDIGILNFTKFGDLWAIEASGPYQYN